MLLETCHKHEAYTVLLDARSVVVHTTNVVNSEELEDVVYAYYNFPIWLLLVHYRRSFGHLEEQVRVLVLLKQRVVLVGQCTPHSLYRYPFTPFELAYEWQTVEQFAVEVP